MIYVITIDNYDEHLRYGFFGTQETAEKEMNRLFEERKRIAQMKTDYSIHNSPDELTPDEPTIIRMDNRIILQESIGPRSKTTRLEVKEVNLEDETMFLKLQWKRNKVKVIEEFAHHANAFKIISEARYQHPRKSKKVLEEKQIDDFLYNQKFPFNNTSQQYDFLYTCIDINKICADHYLQSFLIF